MTAIVIIVSFLVGGGLLAYLYIKNVRPVQQITGGQLRPIHEFPDQSVGRIHGHVSKQGRLLRGPFSGRECVAFHLTVTIGEGAAARVLIDERKSMDFIIEADGDTVYTAFIEAADEDAVVDVAQDTHGQLTDPATLPGRLARRVPRAQAANGQCFVSEGIIEVGESVHVVGAGRWEPNPDAAVADDESKPGLDGDKPQAPVRLRMTAPETHPLTVTDFMLES